MPYLDQNFNELRLLLKQGRGLSNAGHDPVFYLVFRPEEMLEVKRRAKSWIAKLKIDGWNVHIFSMVEAVHSLLKNDGLRDVWLESEKDNPLDFDSINKTLTDALVGNDQLKSKLEQQLNSLADQENALLLITDLEAIHPYLRIGSLEQKLQGKFRMPTVILYPGIRTGRSALKFLGIYPEDGSYRSTHIGG
jgi:hypothetical protein